MDEILLDDMAKIRQFLETKANALAIILCGSRSVGDYKENSDWDLKILVENYVVAFTMRTEHLSALTKRYQ